MPIWRELCSSACAARLCQLCRRKWCCSWRRTTWSTTTTCSISAGIASMPDIAQIDLDRLELQRVQYESDLQAAEENLETAKIQLLTLLNSRAPLDQFDVIGPYDFNDQLLPRDEFRKIAMDTRPDLKAAVEAVDKAQTDHKLEVANGSTDPTLSAWY